MFTGPEFLLWFLADLDVAHGGLAGDGGHLLREAGRLWRGVS